MEAVLAKVKVPENYWSCGWENSGTLGKDTINNWIIPFLSVGKRFSFNKGAQPDVYFDEEL